MRAIVKNALAVLAPILLLGGFILALGGAGKAEAGGGGFVPMILGTAMMLAGGLVGVYLAEEEKGND